MRTLDRCDDPPRHHCLQHPHGVEDTCFYFLFFAFDSILATFSLIVPVFLAWHCVFHAPAFRCRGEIFAALEAGTCAVSRVWNFI